MQPALDLKSFRTNGYAVLHGAVSSSMISRLCTELARVEAACSSMSEEERERNFVFEKDLSNAGRGGISAHYVGSAIFIIGDLCRYIPFGYELLALPTLADASALALGTGPSGVTAHFMNATIKHPIFGRAIGWHRDFPNDYLSGESSSFLRLMICLDGMQAHGGATRFIPGTHLVSDEEVLAEKKQGLRHRRDPYAGQPVECGPGDVVLIHPKVVHGSPANHSTEPRRNIVIQVGVAGMALVGEREEATGRMLGPACAGDSGWLPTA